MWYGDMVREIEGDWDKEMETKIKNGKESKFNKALKQFNKNKPNWCIPKKGTKDYKKVMEIMEGLWLAQHEMIAIIFEIRWVSTTMTVYKAPIEMRMM